MPRWPRFTLRERVAATTRLSWSSPAAARAGGGGVPCRPGARHHQCGGEPQHCQRRVHQQGVAGSDDGGAANLAYTWASVQAPAAVQFSANGTSAAKSTTATFSCAGTYRAPGGTVADAQKASAQSTVNVTVSQSLGIVKITPATACDDDRGDHGAVLCAGHRSVRRGRVVTGARLDRERRRHHRNGRFVHGGLQCQVVPTP